MIHVEGGKKNFWNLESDIAYNFSHYMRKYNPDYLDIGFLPHNEFFQIWSLWIIYIAGQSIHPVALFYMNYNQHDEEQ